MLTVSRLEARFVSERNGTVGVALTLGCGHEVGRAADPERLTCASGCRYFLVCCCITIPTCVFRHLRELSVFRSKSRQHRVQRLKLCSSPDTVEASPAVLGISRTQAIRVYLSTSQVSSRSSRKTVSRILVISDTLCKSVAVSTSC